MWLLYTCVHLIGLLEYDRSGEEAQTMNLYFCSFFGGGRFWEGILCHWRLGVHRMYTCLNGFRFELLFF